jgi:thymidine phosphorylase
LAVCGIAPDVAAGRRLAEATLARGAAAEKFARMVAALGGPADIFADRTALTPAPIVRAVGPERPGIVTSMDTRAIGLAIIALGGGRTRGGQRIDPGVGFSDFAAIGETVDSERPLCLVHAADEGAAMRAMASVRGAVTIGDLAPMVAEVVRERVR